MATKNFFDLLGDDENEDPSEVVVRANSIPAVAKSSAVEKKKPAAPAKLPTKPVPPSEAARDVQRTQHEGGRGGRGSGRSGRGNFNDREGSAPREGGHRERNFNADYSHSQTRDADGFVGARGSHGDKPARTENGEGRSYEGGRGGGRGPRRGGRGYGEGDERPRRREFDRHSGAGRGNESEKRSGAGRGNWGTEVDSSVVQETIEAVKEDDKPVAEGETEKKAEATADVTTGEGAAEPAKEEEEDNEMTLEEYEKVLVEKRKALEEAKAAERTVEADKEFEKMQLVDNKKREEDIFIKLGQEKEKMKRENAEKEEKLRKPVSINEFLKPAEGEKSYFPSTRGRGGRGGRGDRREGSGRGDRDSTRGSFGGGRFGGGRGPAGGNASAPKIEDQSQFPTLGGK